jgi:carboxymethylenebutenolidase
VLQTQAIELQSDAGRTFDAHLAIPGRPSATGVLILSEMFGLNGPMRDVAARFAEAGYCALVPNLFWRCERSTALAYEGPDREVAWKRLATFDADAAAVDIKRAATWLRSSPHCNGKVAALGFCMGGKLAYLAAARAGVDAAVSLYGLGIAKHVGEASQVRCPVQLHYGLKDEHVPQAEIDAVVSGVRGKPQFAVHLYADAGHSFCNPVRPTYNAKAAAEAWKRIDALFASI